MNKAYTRFAGTLTSGKIGELVRDSRLRSEKQMTVRKTERSSSGVASRFIHALLLRALAGDDLPTIISMHHIFV